MASKKKLPHEKLTLDQKREIAEKTIKTLVIAHKGLEGSPVSQSTVSAQITAITSEIRRITAVTIMGKEY